MKYIEKMFEDNNIDAKFKFYETEVDGKASIRDIRDEILELTNIYLNKE